MKKEIATLTTRVNLQEEELTAVKEHITKLKQANSEISAQAKQKFEDLMDVMVHTKKDLATLKEL